MHWGPNGREPLNGLTWERATPALEFARTQTRDVQTWAGGYYNAAGNSRSYPVRGIVEVFSFFSSIGASVFGQVWQNPDDPQWTTDLKFPAGTCVFKVLHVFN
jgi:hypothetical protein